MSEEGKVETADEQNAESGTEVASGKMPDLSPKKKKKKWIVIGVLAVVLVAAGAGFWVWHETPGFCGAICHTPMNEYVEGYDQDYGVEGIDKYGNKVTNTASMLAVSHKVAGEDCLSCHVPTIGEQVTEGIAWVTGDYYYPLEERSASDLTEARGLAAEQFCLNEGCHNFSVDDLAKVTADEKRNPHVDQHKSEYECTDCHKAHRASVNQCASSGCHADAPLPDGWQRA